MNTLILYLFVFLQLQFADTIYHIYEIKVLRLLSLTLLTFKQERFCRVFPASSAAIRLAGHQRHLSATIGIHQLVEVTELRRFEIN